MDETVSADLGLIELEAIIEAAVGAAGQALSAIHDRKLYKPTYKTWELYCHERWQMSADAGYRQIEQAKALAALPPGSPLPSQRAVRAEKQNAARGGSVGALTSTDGREVRGKSLEAIDVSSTPSAVVVPDHGLDGPSPVGPAITRPQEPPELTSAQKAAVLLRKMRSQLVSASEVAACFNDPDRKAIAHWLMLWVQAFCNEAGTPMSSPARERRDVTPNFKAAKK